MDFPTTELHRYLFAATTEGLHKKLQWERVQKSFPLDFTLI